MYDCTFVVVKPLCDIAVLHKIVEILVLQLEIRDGGDVFDAQALGILGDQGAFGVAEGQDVSSELDDLERSVLSDIASSGDQDALAGPVGWDRELLQHVRDEVDEAVASGFGPDAGAAIGLKKKESDLR